MDLEPNTLLRDRYRIIEQLGKGGMGAVYLAHDTVLATRVAVKINQNPRPEGRDQFLAEARLLAGLRHPNLPRVIDYFVIQDSQYLVMDFVPGDDLGSIIKRDGIQPVDRVLRWAQQLGNALTYLHSQHPPVIHRDIKPANIKLTPGGDVMLVDFGIAKAADISQETSTGARGLTPGYSPPEQYGSGRTGPYSDQFALAATLYNLLTAQKPADAVERLMGQSELTPISALNPQVPVNIQQIIERALSVKPEDRFPSVQALTQALQPAKSDATLVTPTREAHTAEPVNTDATVVGATPPTTPPVATKKRNLLWPILGGVVIVGAIIVVAVVLLLKNFLGSGSPENTPTAVVAVVPSEIIELPTETSMPTATNTALPTETATATLEPTATLTNTPEATLTPTQVMGIIGRGGLVAFASNEADGETFQIWTLKVYEDQEGNLVAGEKTQLTTNPGNKYYPNWSPDGTKIVYSADSGDSESKLDLWTMNPDGSNQSNILAIPGDETQSVWSPDGQWIVFTTNSREDGNLQLMIVHPDGSGLRRISTDNQEFSPEFSPAMDKLVYVLPAFNARYLWIRDPQNDFIDTEKNLMYGRLKYFDDPAWSPDGLWLAYTRIEGRMQDIYLTRVLSYGLEIKRLTNTTYDTYPAWSSDSAWIVFSSNRDGNQELYIMDIQGQNQTNLTNTANAQEIQPAWQIK